MPKMKEWLGEETEAPRWQVVGGPHKLPGGARFLHLWPVWDRALERTLSMLTLNYEDVPAARLSWDIPSLREAFLQLVSALSPNHLCLPEPVDLLSFCEQSLPTQWCAGEPGLVFAAPGGERLTKLKVKGKRRASQLRQLCLNLAYALRDLHVHGCLVRALPFSGIRRNPASGSISIQAFQTLCRLQDAKGISRHEAGFRPLETHAAPECFVPGAPLSPASDVYALGRLLLEAPGETLPFEPFSPKQLEVLCQRLALDEMWTRFFKLALQRTPEARFHGMSEVIAYVTSYGDVKHGVRGRSQRQKASSGQAKERSCKRDAPSAALLIWGDELVPRGKRLNYRRLLSHLQSRYHLKPVILFAQEQRDMNNSFFQFLRQLSFEIIPCRFRELPQQIVSDARMRWHVVEHLIVVGNANHIGVSSLLQSGMERASVELYATQGKAPRGVTVRSANDFIEKKSAVSKQHTKKQRR